MVVDVKRTEADLVVIENGIPTLVRGLQFSRNESPEDKLPILLEEMKRNLKFYGTRSKGQVAAPRLPVLVAGEFDGNKTLLDIISREVKCEVSTITTRMISPNGSEVRISDYMANIGLATHRLKQGIGINPTTAIDVNLLPEVYRVHGPSAANLAFAAAGVLLPALLGFVSFQTVSVMNEIKANQAQLESARLSLEQAISGRAENLAAITDIRNNIAASQKIQGSLTVIRTMMAENNGEIEEIISLIDKDLSTAGRLSTVSYTGSSSLELTGIVPDEADVLAYIEELSRKYPSSQIFISSMSRNDINNLVEYMLKIDKGR